MVLTSGCSLTGTYTFSVSVVTIPSGSGRTSGSFLTPFIWNKLARTFAISAKKETYLLLPRTSVQINYEDSR